MYEILPIFQAAISFEKKQLAEKSVGNYQNSNFCYESKSETYFSREYFLNMI